MQFFQTELFGHVRRGLTWAAEARSRCANTRLCSVSDLCPYLAEAFQPKTWPLLFGALPCPPPLNDDHVTRYSFIKATTCMISFPRLSTCGLISVPVFPVFWAPRTRSLTGTIFLSGLAALHENHCRADFKRRVKIRINVEQCWARGLH